jgi:hypothetical protein
MAGIDLFQTWAPDDRHWAQWAKPVLFAHCGAAAMDGSATADWPKLDAPNDQATALLIDLPRAMAVDYGIAAARDHFWPVPIFNCATGPGAVLMVDSIMARLALGAAELKRLNIPADAPPAFLLDSKRMEPDRSLTPGNFDNRYVILPQDFPSAGYLRAHGISRMIWIPQPAGPMIGARSPRDDLAHVLRRWQEGGVEIFGTSLETGRTERLEVKKPAWFRSLFYRGMVLAGLRRSSAGGFGGIIPQPSSGG